MAKRYQFPEEQIRDWVAQGWGVTRIGSALGKDPVSVYNFCKRRGITLQKGDCRKSLDLVAIKAAYDGGESLFKLQKRVGLNANIIKERLREYYPDIKFRTMDEIKRPAELNNREKFLSLVEKSSFTNIARSLGVKVTTVCAAAQRFGIKSRYDFRDNDILFDTLHKYYIICGLPISKICTALGKKYGYVLRQIRKAGFNVHKPGGVVRLSRHAPLNDREWLEEHYINKGMSMADIADIIGTTVGNISHHLRKHNIKIRSRTESLRGLMNKSHGVKSEMLGMKLDSKLEASYIETVPNANIARNVELESNGSVCYVDFMVDNSYVEIKSKERSTIPGCERRQLVKQYLIAKNNGIDLQVWNGDYYKLEIEDNDVYYAINWKLIFDTPDKCCDWLLQYGFRGVKYSKMDLIDGVKKILAVPPQKMLNANYPNSEVLKVIRHFYPHYWRSAHKGYRSVAAVWELGNEIILRDAVRMLWADSRDVNLYGLIKLIPKDYKDFNTVSIFKPWVARHIYNKYLPDGGTIVDPCVGWGGRMLACIDGNYSYLGIDLNPEAVKSTIEMSQFIKNKLSGKIECVCGDSSAMTLPDGDLLLTSPPYDDAEYYYGLEHQCKDTTPIYENIFSFKGAIALNIPKYHEDRCMEIAGRHGRCLLERMEMKTSALIRRTTTSEPILVFKSK